MSLVHTTSNIALSSVHPLSSRWHDATLHAPKKKQLSKEKIHTHWIVVGIMVGLVGARHDDEDWDEGKRAPHYDCHNLWHSVNFVNPLNFVYHWNSLNTDDVSQLPPVPSKWKAAWQSASVAGDRRKVTSDTSVSAVLRLLCSAFLPLIRSTFRSLYGMFWLNLITWQHHFSNCPTNTLRVSAFIWVEIFFLNWH